MCAAWRKQDDGSGTKETLAAGAAGAGAALLPAVLPANALVAPAVPPQVLAANDMALWYDEPAGAEWLRALPIGNGRLGAMVFGNIDTERLQLNEDTVWAGGPYDSANTRGAAALPEIRRRVFADQWTQAQDLINQTMRGTPAGQLAYQPGGNLRLASGSAAGAAQYRRTLDLTTATVTTTAATLDRVAAVARGRGLTASRGGGQGAALLGRRGPAGQPHRYRRGQYHPGGDCRRQESAIPRSARHRRFLLALSACRLGRLREGSQRLNKTR